MSTSHLADPPTGESAGALALHHVAVVVGDLDQAEAFYAGVLGLHVIRRWDDSMGRPRAVWMSLGHGAFLALEKAALPGPPRADATPGFHCVALSIAPGARSKWRGRLAAAGVLVERESPFTLYLRDPDGNLLGLSQFPSDAP